MTQFIVTHIDGSKLNLHSRAKGTFVESAKFRNRWQSYAELTLEITAYKAPEWAYFDMLVVDDTPVFLHEWNEAKHIDNKGTKYILHFYGVEKMLFEASPFLDIDSAGVCISKEQPPLVGNLEFFGNVLCNCVNYRGFDVNTGQRYKQNTIKLGTCPAGTKHLLVSTTEYNAFAALLAVCSAFKTHYTITINPADDTDYLLNFGVAPGVYAPLAYGRGKGLYRLDRKSISNENVKTILTVLGSSKNLPQGYGKQRLELDETLYPGSIIADNDKIQTFGAWNDVYIAEDIMPEYRGEILGVNTEDKFTFYCELDDFDPTGGTLNMLTGNLAGSNFRIAAFNAANGKITVEELVDSSGFAVPSVAPYLFATGDTFTIVDIPMPQAYIEIAQQALAEAGQARYLEVSQPRVAYNVALHSRFVKSHGSRPRVGMYFPISDARYGVDKAVQCVTLERNLLAQDEYEYTNCEVADNVVETLGAKIYKQSKEAQALLKHLGATRLTTPTSSLQGTARTAQSAAVAAAEAVAALEAEAARIAAEAYADGILSDEEAARIADVAAKLTEAKQYAAAQAEAAESAAKTYAEGQAAAAQAAAEAVAAAEAEAAELAANAYADGIVDAEEARAIAEAAAKLTEAKNHANTQAAAAEAAASTYAAAQAEAARLAAIASAKTYTDTEVTAAKGYADSTAAAAQSAAEAYALAKANLAETNAEAYADGIVDAEEAARIAEATAKLNEAKTYAETKATAAENAAKAYADTQLGNFATTVTGSLSDLQNQIDGNITTWFYAYVPTTGNAPANTWTTTALKNQHIGDLFYVNNDSLEEDGFCYRWTGTAWELIKDTQITKALADAAAAQDTADSKRRVFVATPTTPYDIGDLWLKSGDLYKCKVARLTGSYVASDWEKGVKYTDDTVANAAAAAAAAAQSAADDAQDAADAANALLTNIASDSKLTASEKQATKKEWDIIQ
ncbi:MAG TPA: hypothetical protein GX706_04500, partial [Candidatus Moranbacteria bacterium]|nr:hypothetical protein [Candidatus Moranbacteria bacterium]